VDVAVAVIVTVAVSLLPQLSCSGGGFLLRADYTLGTVCVRAGRKPRCWMSRQHWGCSALASNTRIICAHHRFEVKFSNTQRRVRTTQLTARIGTPSSLP
jgi:hypothetical protein